MAQNLLNKRQNIAANMVVEVTALVRALNALQELKAERAALPQDFQDSDFVTGLPVLVDGVSVRIDHLDAYTAGSVFDFGLTPMVTAYLAGTPTPQSVFLKTLQ